MENVAQLLSHWRRQPKNLEMLIECTVSEEMRKALIEAKEYLEPADNETIQRMSENFRDIDGFKTLMLKDE